MPKIITLADVSREQRQQLRGQTQQQEIKTVTRSDVRASFYQLTLWKRLRSEYRRLHPLDELSLLGDRVEAAEDVHHIISPFEVGRNEQEILILLLDADNLISLTKLHHGQIHGNASALSDDEKEYLRQRKEAVRAKYHFII